MPVTNTAQLGSCLYQEDIYDPVECGTYMRHYEDKVIKRTIIGDNVTSTRIKPGDLMGSPTASSAQYTRIIESPTIKRNTPFYEWIWCNHVGGYVQAKRKEFYNTVEPDLGNPTWVEPDWSTEFRHKVKDASINLGQSIAEYRQTARMFKGFAQGAKNAWDVFRVARLRKRPLTPCTVAAAELVYSYGVAPLASDLFDSWEELRLRLGLPIYRQIRMRKTESHPYTIEQPGFDGVHKGVDRRSVYISARVSMDPNVSPFTLGNPAEIAWELVPYSFVIDWAIPIGDYLGALDALRGVTAINGTKTRRRRVKGRYYTNHSTDWSVIDPGSYLHRHHDRSVLNSIPLPSAPTWEPSKSWRAVMNGLALLTSVNKRCKRTQRPIVKPI